MFLHRKAFQYHILHFYKLDDEKNKEKTLSGEVRAMTGGGSGVGGGEDQGGGDGRGGGRVVAAAAVERVVLVVVETMVSGCGDGSGRE